MEPITISDLTRFTKQKAALITKYPVNLVLKDLSKFYHNPKSKRPTYSKKGHERFRVGQIKRFDADRQIYYVIELDLTEFRMERYKNTGHLKNIILHELSHIPEWETGKNPTHGRLFKEAANKLGVSKTYIQGRWDSAG